MRLQDYIDGATVAQLHIKQIRPESFRMYTIVAENSVAIAAKDVQLYQSRLFVLLPVCVATY
jgi:hypothetical protein